MGKEGYRKLIVWQNAYKLRRLVYEITKKFAMLEVRRISQMRDAARSIKQNIQEGYGKTLGEYLHSLEISRGSLRELSGDVEDCFDDKLITEEEFAELISLCGKTDYLFMKLIQSLRLKQKAQ
jgi:four helix bundle protein